MPDDLYDAGVVDGASKFTIYVRIFLPLMKTIIATLAILDVVNNWNDLLWPMIVLSKNELNTIQLGLIRYMSGASGQVHAGISTALSILSVLPLAMVFVFLQKYIVQSIASTGIKQ
ncbi:ABC transporter permease subunit [Anaerocolumna sedimenticola]|uniref:ABC transporter permease subunit n=1 Tax=Anaerocolumna sedimenticola TaxID=2696063 RepID=A0A6P1TNW7_9FIRM|nr:ABC transporter permease subunit [Anaerocolumna sedimenticola]